MHCVSLTQFLLVAICVFTGLHFAYTCTLDLDLDLLDTECAQVGSFNVKFFTPSKSTDQFVLDIVSKVISRYDIMLMLEIRDDDSRTAMTRLWAEVNKTAPYGLAMSQPLGRTVYYTEEYGFFYRLGKIDLLDTFQYDDSANNEFEREPYAALFKLASQSATVNGIGTAFIASHIQPENAICEMNHMVEVTDAVLGRFNTTKGVVLGDLNADCSYMSASKLDQTPLRTDSRFTWLIPDTADTTVSTNTDCAYDRFIVTDTVVHDTANVFYFDQDYNMTFDEAYTVSDHYPIEVMLCLL